MSWLCLTAKRAAADEEASGGWCFFALVLLMTMSPGSAGAAWLWLVTVLR
jgi:hypothetical protein